MGRPLKLIVCVVALTAGGGVALAAAGPGAASVGKASRMIICPLEPSSAITTCCGPPVATAGTAPIMCCAAGAQIACPVPLIAGSTPNPSTAGRQVTISGRWSGATAGQTVVLWRKLPAAKTFSRAGQTTAGSSGQFQLVRRGVQTNREWYVTVGADRSLTIDQRVRAVVTLIGGSTLRGRVSPSHAGQRVLIERRAGSRWVVVERPRLTRRSTYSAKSIGLGVRRAVFPGDARNIRSVSPILGVQSGY